MGKNDMAVAAGIQAAQAISELLEKAELSQGDILVIGCSTGEVAGSGIGSGAGSELTGEIAFKIAGSAITLLRERGIRLAAQCCEHLNRALVVEADTALTYGLEQVCARPCPAAGGAFASAVYTLLDKPVVVESVKAHAGIDIGSTLIGMHLRGVAVPVRISVHSVGHAAVVCARTRPKYIGGPRTIYC